jgi:hypothetical protein
MTLSASGTQPSLLPQEPASRLPAAQTSSQNPSAVWLEEFAPSLTRHVKILTAQLWRIRYFNLFIFSTAAWARSANGTLTPLPMKHQHALPKTAPALNSILQRPAVQMDASGVAPHASSAAATLYQTTAPSRQLEAHQTTALSCLALLGLWFQSSCSEWANLTYIYGPTYLNIITAIKCTILWLSNIWRYDNRAFHIT